MSQRDTETSNQPGASSHSHSHKEHGHGYQHQDPADWIPGVELDAKISMPPVMDRLLSTVDVGDPSLILDVGCGPGVGTVTLARRFPSAQVRGLDLGEAVLEAAGNRAVAEGLSDRVRFIRADFDSDLTEVVEPADMVFASMSLHHTEDPALALARVCDRLVRGGRLVMVEFGRPLMMWPEDHEMTSSGRWSRWQAAAEAERLDHLGAAAMTVQWMELLAAQNLDRVEQHECDIVAPAPVAELQRAWLTKGLTRGLEQFGQRLEPSDRAAIEALLDTDNPDGVANSDQIFLDTSRMLYTGLRL